GFCQLQLTLSLSQLRFAGVDRFLRLGKTFHRFGDGFTSRVAVLQSDEIVSLGGVSLTGSDGAFLFEEVVTFIVFVGSVQLGFFSGEIGLGSGDAGMSFANRSFRFRDCRYSVRYAALRVGVLTLRIGALKIDRSLSGSGLTFSLFQIGESLV